MEVEARGLGKLGNGFRDRVRERERIEFQYPAQWLARSWSSSNVWGMNE